MALVQRINHRIAALNTYLTGVQAMRANRTYHKYVFWHSQVGSRTDPTDPRGRRNVAHRGPVFLPWHRELLWRFEQDLQAALGNPDFGLPYWNWAADKTDGALATSQVWTELGANSGSLVFGGTTWTRMTASLTGGSYNPVDTTTPVTREYDGFSEPTFGHEAHIRSTAQAEAHVADLSVPYDQPDWNMVSSGFRTTNENQFHDHVHVLVGGDVGEMSRPALACNDPIFFLHHAMIDRLWAHWQQNGVGAGTPLDAQYRPTMSEAVGIQLGHRIDEPMWPWNDSTEMTRWGLPTEDVTPRMVLDHRSERLNYVYDDQDPDGCLPAAGRILREILGNLRFGRRRG